MVYEAQRGLTMRKAMDFVKQKFQDQLIVGAEVGVATGTHALEILENMPNVRLLYLVDPYQHYPEWTTSQAQDRRFWPEDMEILKKKAMQNLSSFKNRIRWIFKKFAECTAKEIDKPLDFIYIDGNHAYDYVKKDIEVAKKLVKKGGVIGGHDFGWIGNGGGVNKAVTEHSEKTGIPFTQEDRDWWFINP